MNDLELLAQSDLFSAFDPEALTRVLASAYPVRYRRNQVIFNEGDKAEALYGVRTGRIAIGLQSHDGRESLLALMEAGDLFGDMPLFDRGGRSAQARALETSDLVCVPYPPVRAVLEEAPDLLWCVVAMLSRRLRSTDAALADSVFLDVTGRTAKRLLELAGDADTFVLPITQEELAGLVGASRERVNKAIAAFVRLGWLDQVDRRYRIRDRAQLVRRAR
ncbi:MAG: Crp/Fnr family transcriptional regulator [Actinomycetota bacterium]|nr:Crp/Fnr family transcriptional regulator [Actinomycetota bacterium]